MAVEVVDTYDFAEDAMGFGDFIVATMNGGLNDDEIVVYVSDQDGRDAKVARFERETLSDGSTVVNLIIEFEE